MRSRRVAIGLALVLAAAGAQALGAQASTFAPTCVGGSITASGSTALQPLAQAAAQDYQSKCAGSTINVSGGGSSAGLSNVASGTSNIGDSDIPAKYATGVNSAGLVDHQVAIVLFAVAVNSKANVTNLSTQQVRDIFAGRTTNWSQVGGANQAIVLIERKAGSGTRFAFDKILMGPDQESQNPAAQEDSTQLVMQALQQQPGAVSYAAVSSVVATTGVTALKLNGVNPDQAGVSSGAYGFYAHEHMYTKGNASGLTAAYINYIMSPEYQGSGVPAQHFIPLSATARQSLADQ